MSDKTVNGNPTDEEMGLYKAECRNAITFRIVREEEDLEAPATKNNSFKPEMAHQIFGESEMIFGYRQLSINLWYLHNSAKCFVETRFSGKIVENESYKADDIMKALNPWLPENFRLKKEQFKQDIDKENHKTLFGDIIDTFEGDRGTYKITICNTEDKKFQQFHQRFETFITWFIDGANFIDLDDNRWIIFYIYEEYEDSATKKKYCSPIGFCTVYKFFLYPDLIRPRISQFFVLPTHQRKGIGTKLYSTVFRHLRAMPQVGDITVEEPTEMFQRIRDFCDSLYVYWDLEARKVNIRSLNQKQVGEYWKENKICKRQAQRIFDILECLISHKNGYGEYKKFTESIKARIANQIEKETKGCKRLCNLQRAAVIPESADRTVVDGEYNRYIDTLEWPVNRLRNFLAKSVN